MRETAVFAFFLALAVALTWPLAAQLSTAVIDPGDPLLNAFILDWVSHALAHEPLRLFHAPIFYPFPYALALSEHMTGIALLVLPFHVAGVSAIALHNLAMLVSFALSGFGAYVLARMFTHDTIASVAAGVFYAFVSFKFDHLAHVQVIASGWIPLTLAALLAFRRSGSWRDAALFAGAFTMNGLTNIYWLLFTAFTVVATIAFLGGFPWKRLAIASIASAVVLLPFLVPYEIVKSEYRMYRTSFEAMGGSATPRDWLAASPSSIAYGWWGGGSQERRLFPGILPIALALAAFPLPSGEGGAKRRVRGVQVAAMVLCVAVGLVLLPRHASDIPFMLAAILIVAALPRTNVAFLWIAIGFIGSLGEHAFLQPFLFRVFEPFRATRTPARWAVIAYCGLAVLMAVGASRLRKLRWAVVVLAIVEVIPRITWNHVPAQFPPVYTWLAHARPHAAIELPIGWTEQEARYVLASSVHRVPIMNGVSGFDPPIHRQLSQHVDFDTIVRNGVNIVIVHPGAQVDTSRLDEIVRFPDGDVVYRIRT